MAQNLINSALKCFVSVRHYKDLAFVLYFTAYHLPITGLFLVNSHCISFLFKNIFLYTLLQCLYVCMLGTSPISALFDDSLSA